MKKIANDFWGYLKVGNDIFAYSVSNNIVTMLPAQSEVNKRYDVFRRMRSHNIEQPEFLFGEDSDGMIAMLRNSKYSISGINTSIRFATPIIIKAAGNAQGFFNLMTEDWRKFHAITFYGGSINAICYPGLAVEKPSVDNYLNNDGTTEIKLRPWKDYTREIECEIDNEKAILTISVSQSEQTNNAEHMGAYSLVELNSYIRLSFENAQDFDKIGRYYVVIKNMIAILTSQNNISFGLCLNQRTVENKYFKTGICKIYENYENYSMRKWNNVISINAMLDYLPKLIEKITSNEADSLLTLLPEDNKRLSRISITDIQDLCTALEVAYKWEKRGREKDLLIEELKKNIKSTIADFIASHDEIDVNKETTISSAFQYLDFTLKQKIFTLYKENCDIIDAVVSKWSLPQVNEDNIASFVKLRNNKTHSGTVEWGDSANLYTALLALVYACFFRYIEVPEDIIKRAVLQIM